MPEGFLFDTVTCSRWRRGDRMLRRRIEALPMDAALYTSVISVGELTFGIHKAPYEYQERLWQRTREILARFQSILEVNREVADRYGTIVAQVPPGQHIGQNDYWIAAIALTHNLVLITNDPDFDRIHGLPQENWLICILTLRPLVSYRAYDLCHSCTVKASSSLMVPSSTPWGAWSVSQMRHVFDARLTGRSEDQ